MKPILSIYTVDKFIKVEKELKYDYERSVRNLDTKSPHLQSAYLQALVLKHNWISDNNERNSSIKFDSIDVDLFLRFGPSDKLDCIIIFLEEYLPDINLPEDSPLVNSYIRVNHYLCIKFDPDASDHCQYITKRKLSEYKEVVCYD